MLGLIVSFIGATLAVSVGLAGALLPRIAFLVALVAGSTLSAAFHGSLLLVLGFLIAPGASLAYSEMWDFGSFTVNPITQHSTEMHGVSGVESWALILVVLCLDLYALSRLGASDAKTATAS